MTQATTKPATVARHDGDMTHDTTLRQHTVASITLEAGSTKRTVQRWVSKCGDIGALKNNIPHFSDAEKAQILSHQSKRAAGDEAIEAELIEPGAIELHTSAAQTAAPLIQFDIQAIELNVPGSDLSALQQQTAQLEQVVNQGANAVAYALAARFQNGVAQIVAEQDNLLQGIRAQALNGAARSVAGQQEQP
ncbi:MAG: hypothetical protein WBA76_20645 [Phormidesmis sp.]